jgi:hypothetical protein
MFRLREKQKILSQNAEELG